MHLKNLSMMFLAGQLISSLEDEENSLPWIWVLKRNFFRKPLFLLSESTSFVDVTTMLQDNTALVDKVVPWKGKARNIPW